MAYRLRKHESIGKGLRRVVKEELRSAIDGLRHPEPSGSTIHEARKSLKKVRAVLQLVGETVGAERERTRLRKAGRRLSPVRDAQVVLSSAKTLCERGSSTLSTEACAAILRLLEEHKEHESRVAERDQAPKRAAIALAKVRRSTADWPVRKLGFSLLGREIGREYKKARRAMAAAQDHADGTDFHEWRKQVKTLWYALRLLERRVPKVRRQLTDLKRLETWLGEDHDLLMLLEQLRTNGHRRLNHSSRTRAITLSEQRQAVLRRRALALGARLFEDTPKTFRQHLTA